MGLNVTKSLTSRMHVEGVTMTSRTHLKRGWGGGLVAGGGVARVGSTGGEAQPRAHFGHTAL